MDTYRFQFCPNCRSEHILFPNQHRFECLDCHMLFYQNIATAVAVIIEKDSKILFTVRNQEPQKGKLDLPGGFTDPEETAEETCSRELKEELDIHISPSQFHYFSSRPNNYQYRGFTYRTEDLVFITKLPDSAVIRLEETEIKAIKWMKLSDIQLSEIAFQSLQEAIQLYLSHKNY